MAPITRKASAVSSKAESKVHKKNKQDRKDLPSPLKSALRRKERGPVEGRKVTFNPKEYDNVAHPHLSTTPHPITNQAGISTPAQYPSLEPLDLSKRTEQEELLKRADNALQKMARNGSHILSPPPSRRDGSISPFAEAANTPTKPIKSHEQIKGEGQTKDDVQIKDNVQAKGDVVPKIANADLLTPGFLDTIRDDIPRGRAMPDIINDILIEPSAEIKMEEICTAFDYLKPKIQKHCRSFYGFKQLGYAIPSFTFLNFKHPELFKYIQYVADGSQYGWEQLLSSGPQRENLVYAIISRALVAFVFDAELFGASPTDEEKLLEMCQTYINYDAFVRNTHRAEMIKSVLDTNAAEHASTGKDPLTYFSQAIDNLEKSLALLLGPLLHPAAQKQIGSTDPHMSLRSIIKAALKIHLVIRLAGSNGTVYRFENIHKLAYWDGRSMNCLTQRRMDATFHHGENPLVKICCFPALYAIVPSGPNLEKFSDPVFVEEWKQVFDDDDNNNEEAAMTDLAPFPSKQATKPKTTPSPLSRKPIITTYPITLADVVLENTPQTKASEGTTFLTLTQHLTKEQSKMSDATFHSSTGLPRRARTPTRLRKPPTTTTTTSKNPLHRITKSIRQTARKNPITTTTLTLALALPLPFTFLKSSVRKLALRFARASQLATEAAVVTESVVRVVSRVSGSGSGSGTPMVLTPVTRLGGVGGERWTGW